MLFYPTTGDFSTITVRIDPQNVDATIQQIQGIWSKLGFEEAFTFSFLDEEINLRYQAEARFFQVFSILGMLAIFIACLGLFGLAAYSAEQRTKEIGIRKVLGASISNIVALLSKDFIKLVLVAMLVAFPVAWYMMQEWLQGFAYRINIHWWFFVVAAFVALGIALLTVSFQAIRAAVANPVDSLKTE
ncbi:MAG: hypothetical protein IPJ74_15540 [Saprospiraceae bacterium]|nr:hypothetical protein [Saprospiraceae bacterium]